MGRDGPSLKKKISFRKNYFKKICDFLNFFTVILACIFGQVSLKKIKKKIILHLHKKKVLACIFGFNNRFIKVMRTGQYFKNFKKNYFVFILISGITTLYVRCILDIKFFCWR